MTNEKKQGLCVDAKDLQQVSDSMETHYYSKKGIRINPQWWALLSQDRTYRNIGKNQIKKFIVQTVWKGVDDREFKQGPLHLFEIKIESKDHFWVWEAPTCEMAETIHAIVLSQLRDGVDPEDIVVDNPFN